jgi:hypothetical protein
MQFFSALILAISALATPCDYYSPGIDYGYHGYGDGYPYRGYY